MTPLLPIEFPSIYKRGGVTVSLPTRMARCSPDMKVALFKAANLLDKKGGKLILSDLFRSYDMQLGAYKDYITKRKKAFSPPPGGSLHEAGRAFDLSLEDLKISLKDFWDIAAKCGLSPIISKPEAGKSESWHFECRGSHTMVYDYYATKKGNNFDSPYQAMAASAIVSAGIQHDKYAGRERSAYIQSGVIRLGHDIGNMDGWVGKRTKDALAAMGIAATDEAAMYAAIEDRLQAAFPGEFFEDVTSVPMRADVPLTPIKSAAVDTAAQDNAVLLLAGASPVRAHFWKDRGRAAPGYTKGMALAFASVCRQLDAGVDHAKAMVAKPSGDAAHDVLDWYGAKLTAAGAKLDTPENRLVAMFALLLGLGMRESSGRHCEGRDMSAANVSADTAEAGLFQVSYDSLGNDKVLKALYAGYKGHNDLLDVFAEGVSCSANSWKSWGTGEGLAFQQLTKQCPLFTVLYTGVLIRKLRKHWGPINRKEAEVLSDAVKLFDDIRKLVRP